MSTSLGLEADLLPAILLDMDVNLGPRTDIDDKDCCQDSATNEHKIMNKLGHTTGPSANGLFVIYDIIHRYGGTNVREAPNTHDGDNVAVSTR